MSDPSSTPSLIQDLRALAGGDRHAWERLVLAFAGRFHAAAYHILGDAHAADDATQEAFIALGRAASAFRGEDDAAVARWAVAIACRTALMHARGSGRREQRVRTGLPVEVETMAADPRLDGADPQALAAAMRALHRLPDRHRLPIVLHVFGSMDGTELARELGVSVNAARVRLHRAFEKLRALLVAEGVTAAPALVCAELAQTAPPLPAHDLLARCRGIEFTAPPPPAITPKWILMASTTAAGLALLAWFTLAHHGNASDVTADPPVTVVAEPVAPKLALQWQTEGPHNSFGATPPMVTGDAVLLCGSHNLVCVDRQTGARRWSISGTFEHSRPGVHGDEAIVMMHDAVEAIALKDGSRRWSTTVDGTDNDASVVLRGDQALIATRAGTLWCLDLARQGAVVWSAQNLGGETAWAPGTGSRGGSLLPLWGRRIVALDQAGQGEWSAEIPGLGAEPPVARGGLVYSLAEDPKDMQGTLVALDEATGAERWRRTVPQDRPVPPPTTTISDGDGPGEIRTRSETIPQRAIGACAGPVVAGDVIVVGSATDLLGYAPDGALRWRLPFATFGYRTFTVDALGRIWAGGDHGELLVVSAGGRELLRQDLDRAPEIGRRPLHEPVSDGKDFAAASIGSISNPAVDGDQYFLLTSRGVALCFTTKAQF